MLSVSLLAPHLLPPGFTGAIKSKATGRISFYYKGLKHRLGGPAQTKGYGVGVIEYKETYYINGIQFSVEDYWNHPLVLEHQMNRILEL